MGTSTIFDMFSLKYLKKFHLYTKFCTIFADISRTKIPLERHKFGGLASKRSMKLPITFYFRYQGIFTKSEKKIKFFPKYNLRNEETFLKKYMFHWINLTELTVNYDEL